MSAAKKKQTQFFLKESKNSNTNKDWWNDISESQKQNINEGIKDVEERRTVSSEEFWFKLRDNAIKIIDNLNGKN